MRTRFVEATQAIEGGFNWGKFMVGLFDDEEWCRPSEMMAREPNPMRPRSLLRARGWTPRHVLVVDLETGEGAMFAPGGSPQADLSKHKVWVCPMFEPFLAWLYEQIREYPNSWFPTLPSLVELPDAEPSMVGYRRDGV